MNGEGKKPVRQQKLVIDFSPMTLLCEKRREKTFI